MIQKPKINQQVEFKFQNRWYADAASKHANIGTIIRVSGNDVTVRSGGGAKFHLNNEMIREVGSREDE